MTPLQSGAYQSKILSAAVRQTRHWVEQGQIALRRLRTAATWGAQILLYPAYVAFQSVRLAAVQVRQGLELGLPIFRRSLRSHLSSPPPSIVPTADTPLQQALETIQEFTLPVLLPVALPIPRVDRSSGIVTSAVSALRKLWPRSISPELAEIDCLTLIPTPASTVGIRGVASLLETRSLVLVTHQNEILDILTPAQQMQLRDRIIGAVADYRRYLKTQTRPLLASSRALVRAVQPLWRGARSQFRFLVALLYAIAHTFLQMAVRSAIVPQLAGADQKILPLSLTADLPIQQALRLVEQFSLPAASGYIRGVACQRDTRSLVLVTDQNQIVDHLSEAQQVLLRRRITWDTAHYGRYRQIRQQAHHAFARLQTDDRARHWLPPVRELRRLMAWMQRSPVAIAINLFQEASLGTTPTIEVTTIASPRPVAWLMPVLEWAVAPSVNVASLEPPDWTPRMISSTGAMEPSRQGSTAHSPDYIEAQATLLGYVQTPIESALRWLDRCLLWLEQAIVQIWRWLQQKF